MERQEHIEIQNMLRAARGFFFDFDIEPVKEDGA